MTLSPDIVTSKISTATRWLKLFRTLYHLFLRNTFIHVADYLVDLQALNARITAVEASVNSSIVAVKADVTTSILTHTHIAPQAPAGDIPTGPGIPTTPPTPAIPSAAPLVVHVEAALNALDATLQGTGPSAAPLGQGISLEAQKARIGIRQDIGVV